MRKTQIISGAVFMAMVGVFFYFMWIDTNYTLITQNIFSSQ